MKFVLGIIPGLLTAALCFAAPVERIASPVEGTATVGLEGSLPARAKLNEDQGPVDPAMQLDYITMVMQPSPAQQADLLGLLDEQQDPTSANYRGWLSPEQYADRFGLSSKDIEKITAWLRSQGFEIVQVARGRDWISFRGTAALVENAFHTQIHQYNIGGEQHFSNSSEILIPQALQGIVVGFRGLDDFAMKPLGISPSPAEFFPTLQSFYNLGGSHFLSPDDIATIYDIAPLYDSKIDGSGMKLVVVGQVDVSGSLNDIDDFRSAFSLSKNDPVQTIVGGANPGTSSGDMLESKLDLEWSGGVARNATIVFVTAAVANGGVFTAAQYAIDNKLAPVISMSYGACESDNASFLPSNEVELQKANTEGITFVSSSGDTGAAACDSTDTPSATVASHGLSVTYPASSPEVTGVGGTEFSGDVSNPGLYWNTSNSTNGGSALAYIPETSWNDSASRNQLSASGGGKSSCSNSGCTAGFSKPSWQNGKGVPNDGVRDVPDVATAASPDHDGFIICNNGSCANGIGASPVIVGGTSASAPVFAAIITLLNQSTGATGLGNVNPNLYKLAQTNANGVFHDVTTGNNIVPCTPGTPATAPVALQCPSSGKFGYTAGPGYDLVTGLGSIDASNLVCQWAGKMCTSTGLTVVPAQITPGSSTPVVLTATVTAGQGTGTPTGTVTFFNGSNAVSNPVALVNGIATFTYNVSALSTNVYPMTASYSGDSSFSPSISAVVNLTIGNPTSTTISFAPASLMAGSSGPVIFNASVAPASGSGTPTGTVRFSDSSGPLGGAVPLSNGTASFSYNPSSLAGGTYSISASYSGDANFAPSTSAPQTLNVLDFSIAANPAAITISAPGSNGETTISITDLGGFSQSLSFSCSGLPAEASCMFVPISGGGELLTIATTASSAKWQNHRNQIFLALLLPGVLGWAFFGGSLSPRRTQITKALCMAIVLGSILWMGGCGGSSPPGNHGTPAGTSAVSVKAVASGASAITHQITITLTVQ